MRSNKVIIVPIKSNASQEAHTYLYTHATIEERRDNLLRLKAHPGTTYSVRTTAIGRVRMHFGKHKPRGIEWFVKRASVCPIRKKSRVIHMEEMSKGHNGIQDNECK